MNIVSALSTLRSGFLVSVTDTETSYISVLISGLVTFSSSGAVLSLNQS